MDSVMDKKVDRLMKTIQIKPQSDSLDLQYVGIAKGNPLSESYNCPVFVGGDGVVCFSSGRPFKGTLLVLGDASEHERAKKQLYTGPMCNRNK